MSRLTVITVPDQVRRLSILNATISRCFPIYSFCVEYLGIHSAALIAWVSAASARGIDVAGTASRFEWRAAGHINTSPKPPN